MRQEKHMMDNHAKRNLRGLVASALFAAMLGLGSGTASATAFVIDFTVQPDGLMGAPPTSFTALADTGDEFTFTIAGGGDFVYAPFGGEGLGPGIEAFNFGGSGIIEIKLTSGATFTFDSIFIANFEDVRGGPRESDSCVRWDSTYLRRISEHGEATEFFGGLQGESGA